MDINLIGPAFTFISTERIVLLKLWVSKLIFVEILVSLIYSCYVSKILSLAELI